MLAQMIALLILGVSTAGLIQWAGNVQKTAQGAVQKVGYQPILKQDIINNLKSLLFQKNIDVDGNESQQSQHGICSLVNAPKRVYDITKVTLNLNSQTDSFSESRWTHFFPPSKWEFAPASECNNRIKRETALDNSSRWAKCIKNRPTQQEPDLIYAIASITPKVLAPNRQPGTSLLQKVTDSPGVDPTKLDAKEIMFYLTVEMIKQEGGAVTKKLPSYYADTVWVNDVGECHVKTIDDKWTVVKFSATGPGSNLEKVVLNNPYGHKKKFGGGDQCEANLEIGEINNTFVQGGTNQRETLSLNSLAVLNTKVSCTRNIFKCPHQIDRASTPKELDTIPGYDDLRIFIDVHNHDTDPLTVDSVDFTFKQKEVVDGVKRLQELDFIKSGNNAHTNHKLEKLDSDNLSEVTFDPALVSVDKQTGLRCQDPNNPSRTGPPNTLGVCPPPWTEAPQDFKLISRTDITTPLNKRLPADKKTKLRVTTTDTIKKVCEDSRGDRHPPLADGNCPFNAELKTEVVCINAQGNRIRPVNSNTCPTRTAKEQTAHLSNWCHSICKSYTPSPDDEDDSTYIYPSLTVRAQSGQCQWTKDFENPADRVRCTVCYTKACHRYGLGTFGPYKKEELLNTLNTAIKSDPNPAPANNRDETIEEQQNRFNLDIIQGLPNEALDSTLPECAVDKNYLGSGISLSSYKEGIGDNSNLLTQKPDDYDANTNKCVAYNIEDGTYHAKPCTEELPVLCFSGGQYRPALTIDDSSKQNFNNRAGIAKVNFESAQTACFNMGREIGASYQLFLLLLQQIRPPIPTNIHALRVQATVNDLPKAKSTISPQEDFSSPTSGDFSDTQKDIKYDFINHATRGMLLTPSNYDEIQKNITNKVTNQFTRAETESKFWWTGMEVDAQGYIMASPPYAGVAKANLVGGVVKDQPFAVYFSKTEGTPITLVKDSFNWPANTNSPPDNFKFKSQYFALIHNLRWKGILPLKALEDFSELTPGSNSNSGNQILLSKWKKRSIPFLCKNKSNGRFFVTTKKSPSPEVIPSISGDLITTLTNTHNNNDYGIFNNNNKTKSGAEICKGEQGLFVPPTSSKEWVQAMLALNPNHLKLPFPDPKLPVITNPIVDRGRLQYPPTNATNPEGYTIKKNFLDINDITNTNACSANPANCDHTNAKMAWVALKLKNNPAKNLADNQEGIKPPKIKNMQLAGGQFASANSGEQTSIFSDATFNKWLIINAKAEEVPGSEYPDNLLDDLKKVCIHQNQKVIKNVLPYDQDCPTDTLPLTNQDSTNDSRISFNDVKDSLFFQIQWLQKVTAKNHNHILISTESLQDVKAKIQEKQCKNRANTAYESCKNACPPPPDPPPATTCEAGCTTTHTNAVSACET